MRTLFLFFLLTSWLVAVELPPESFFTDAVDKAHVEDFRTRAMVRNLTKVWSGSREKVNTMLSESGIESPVFLVIERGGGYSGNYYCWMIFKDASAFISYVSGGKRLSIRIDKDNEELKKLIKWINQAAEVCVSRNGNLGWAGFDKTYYFITFYFTNPWSKHESYNSFAYEYGMFFSDPLVSNIPHFLYSAYKKQLEDKKVVKSQKELADEAREAFGIVVK